MVGVAEILGALPAATAPVEEYAAKVHEKWLSRSIIDLGESTVEAALRGDPNEVLDATESRIDALRPNLGRGLELVSVLARTTLPPETQHVATGFGPLDAYLGGLGRGRLITLAARPAIGKTTLALNIAANVARSGKRVGFFSLEMSGEELIERLVLAEAQLPSYKIKARALLIPDLRNLGAALYRMGGWKLTIDDTSTLSTYEVTSRAKRDGSLDLIVIDYLQLMAPPKAESRVQEVSQITRSLKVLARELQVPVLVLSQLSRAVEMRERDGRPRLADLRDSGSIEQDSDQVIFLWREGDDNDFWAETQVAVAKNRHGGTGTFVFRLLKQQSQFVAY